VHYDSLATSLHSTGFLLTEYTNASLTVALDERVAELAASCLIITFTLIPLVGAAVLPDAVRDYDHGDMEDTQAFFAARYTDVAAMLEVSK
jgi:hypothetical protein